MGFNFYSGCHRCKEKVFHLRRKENEHMLDFYKRHSDCIRINPNNVETLIDQIQEAKWMEDDGGYRDYISGR